MTVTSSRPVSSLRAMLTSTSAGSSAPTAESSDTGERPQLRHRLVAHLDVRGRRGEDLGEAAGRAFFLGLCHGCREHERGQRNRHG